MELTIQEVREKEQLLEQVSNELQEALEQQQEAKSLGDFSENEELRTATSKVIELQRKKQDLINQLTDPVIVRPERGPRITLGCTVSLFIVDNNDNMISEPRVMRLASEGDTIQKMTLSVDSPLGKAILNGTSGIYTVQTEGGAIRYDVRKIDKTQ